MRGLDKMTVVKKGIQDEYLSQYLLFTNNRYMGMGTDKGKDKDDTHKEGKGVLHSIRNWLNKKFGHIQISNKNAYSERYGLDYCSNVKMIRLILLDKEMNYIWSDGVPFAMQAIDCTGVPDDYCLVAFDTDYYNALGYYNIYNNRVIFDVSFNKSIIDRLSLIGALCVENKQDHVYTMFIKKENIDKLVNELNRYTANVVPDVFKT